MSEAPVEVGAVNVNDALALNGVAVPIVGAPGVPEVIGMVKLWVAAPLEFVALMTPVKLPVAVGVPDSTPVVPFSVTPVGNAPDVTAKVGAGDPLAVTLKLYAVLR